MHIKSTHKKKSCPVCGSEHLYTQDLDQICLNCDWTNAKLLVDLGQLDQLALAAHRQFVNPVSFEDLEEIENQKTRIDVDLTVEASA